MINKQAACPLVGLRFTYRSPMGICSPSRHHHSIFMGNWISATDANSNHGADANQTEDIGRHYAALGVFLICTGMSGNGLQMLI